MKKWETREQPFFEFSVKNVSLKAKVFEIYGHFFFQTIHNEIILIILVITRYHVETFKMQKKLF